MAPRSEPIFPVKAERPVLETAPLLEKSKKSAAVPRLNVCPRLISLNRRKAVINIFIFITVLKFVLVVVLMGWSHACRQQVAALGSWRSLLQEGIQRIAF
jgi:hypothetical protein